MLTLLSKLKESRDRKGRFGFKSNEVKKIIILPRLIQSSCIDLVQWCNVCKDIVPHARITYDKGKRACKCTHCMKIILIIKTN